MARYIDIANREQFLVPEFADGWNAVLKILEKEPTADVVEVVHGEWIEDGEYQVCSVCGEEHHWDEYRATYCEDCGAKMDGRRDT